MTENSVTQCVPPFMLPVTVYTFGRLGQTWQARQAVQRGMTARIP